MSVPQATIQKVDFQTGSVAASPIGVAAVIAPAGSGPLLTPATYARDDLAFGDFGPSFLAEAVSYLIAEAGNPVLAVRASSSTAAAYGAVNHSGMIGTSVPTAGAAVPVDDYPVTVVFQTSTGAAVAVGAAGITFTYSLDGVSFSAPQALPTGTAPIVLAIPNFAAGGSPGVSFSLAAGNIDPGDSFTCTTVRARLTDADISTALEALRVTTNPWEVVLIDQDIDAGSTGLLDTWLSGLEKVGKFRAGILNTRMKNVGETETAYATAMTTLVASAAPTIRSCVGTDGANLPSTLTGLTLPRPTSLFLAARAMGIAIGVDPAFVADGPLGGAVIIDGKGNPLFHNEENYPNLDQLLLAALRTVSGEKGVYINNARVFSTVGSDYVFLPHIRTMNRACELAFGALTKELGRGVGKKPADPITGGVYILEEDALSIEAMVNQAITNDLEGQVAAFKFSLNRTDDLSANSGATVTSTLALVALAYIKGIKTLAAFAKSISVAA